MMGLLFVLLIVGLFGCNNSSSPQVDEYAHTSFPQPDERVLLWLSKINYDALWNWYLPQQTIDWDAWVEEGKQIPDVEQTLCALLQNRDARVQLPLVATALGKIGSGECVPTLIESLHMEEDAHVRMQAAGALGCLRDIRAVFPLGRLLEVEPDENVQYNAALALAKIGGPDARAILEGPRGRTIKLLTAPGDRPLDDDKTKKDDSL
ncbi:MAG: HEAT repeat domain-containing protein [Kiritimatiellae bacterium]|nr:HEAT repeat domain-containing protein [Kiritimatiellia bacterium]